MTDGKTYDVAISFLAKDEPLALSIEAKLAEHMSVFVYSKKQDEIAGSDGLETFREVFRTTSRLVVVLYRAGWGKTRWTAVEETAIKDRMFNGEWESLLFVSLDDNDELPKWLPETHIRLSFKTYGGDQIVGAIKVRAQKLGALVRIETAMDKARRHAKDSERRQHRERMLQNGSGAFREQYETVFAALSKRLDEVKKELPALSLEYGGGSNAFVARGKGTSISVYTHQDHPMTESRIVSLKFKGVLGLPGQSVGYLRSPEEIGKLEFYFDYDDGAGGWCWRESKTGGPLDAEGVADQIVGALIDLESRFAKGEIRFNIWER